MFTLEIISAFVRPVSLGLRLYGNLFGDHLVLEIFTGLTKVGVPVIFYMLGTLVTVIQAFVFTLLSMIYIALAVAHHVIAMRFVDLAEIRIEALCFRVGAIPVVPAFLK